MDMSIKSEGFHSPEVPWGVIVGLRNRYRINNFVETGTGYGNTSIVAAELFRRVFTVEIDPNVFKHQRKELLEAKNVQRYCGDSAVLLHSIIEQLGSESTVWYLDAHFNGMGEKLAATECPLLDELKLILSRKVSDDCILVDNAGMMTRPPHAPHDPNEWPTIEQIVETLKGYAGTIQLLCDTLIITPDPLLKVYR